MTNYIVFLLMALGVFSVFVFHIVYAVLMNE